MTTTLKSATIGNYYISIVQEKFQKCYKVEDYRLYNGCGGYPLTSCLYCEWKEANARYNYLRRKYEKEA